MCKTLAQQLVRIKEYFLSFFLIEKVEVGVNFRPRLTMDYGGPSPIFVVDAIPKDATIKNQIEI